MDPNSASVNQNPRGTPEFIELIEECGFKLKLCAGVERTKGTRDFGISLRWNETAKWWQPYLLVELFDRTIQAGFLYDNGVIVGD